MTGKLRQQTIDTYNQSAKELAEYFRGIGSRKKYVDLAFKAANNPKNARVLEIGCCDGRDANYISQKADWYLGIDVSEELIKLAKQQVPAANFKVADAAGFEYPANLDLVFAFASLLHLNKQEVKTVLDKVHESLNPDGVFYISLKYMPQYTEQIKKDQFGTRLFYFYNARIIEQLAGAKYGLIKTWRETKGHTEWFEIALRKN